MFPVYVPTVAVKYTCTDDMVPRFQATDNTVPVGEQWHIPVSYTHLDVYKRQIYSLILKNPSKHLSCFHA